MRRPPADLEYRGLGRVGLQPPSGHYLAPFCTFRKGVARSRHGSTSIHQENHQTLNLSRLVRLGFLRCFRKTRVLRFRCLCVRLREVARDPEGALDNGNWCRAVQLDRLWSEWFNRNLRLIPTYRSNEFLLRRMDLHLVEWKMKMEISVCRFGLLNRWLYIWVMFAFGAH